MLGSAEHRQVSDGLDTSEQYCRTDNEEKQQNVRQGSTQG